MHARAARCFPVLVATCLLLAACRPGAQGSGSGDAAAPSVAPSQLPQAAESPAPTRVPTPGAGIAAVDQLEWTRVDLEAGDADIVLAVAAWGDGFVAAGTAYTFDLGPASTGPPSLADLVQAVFWHSADGLRWERSPDDPAYRGVMVTNLLALDDRLLAFGVAGICWPDACSLLPPNGGAVILESTDGAGWHRLRDTGLEAAAVRSVIRAGPGLVAAGNVADAVGKPDDDSFSEPTDAAAWTSKDGRTWTVAALPPEPDEAGSLAVHDDGVLGLVASDSTDLTYWRSLDAGRTWSEEFSLGDSCCGTVTAAFGDSLVVVRRGLDSDDGFTAQVLVGDVSAQPATLTSVASLPDFDALSLNVAGDVLLLAGHRVVRTDLLPEAQGPVLYASLDGRTWEQVSTPPAWGGLSIARLVTGPRAHVAMLAGPDLGAPADDHNSFWVAPFR